MPPHTAPAPVQRLELPPLGATLVNRYILEERLAEGGMATVFRAKDLVLEQPVAVKIIHSGGGDPHTPTGRILSDLRHEAIASMQLSHPNIIRIFNYEKSEKWGFLVMEYVVGEDLRAYRNRFPRKCLPPDEALRIGERALRGLAHAHGLGIIHHDIKPANVMLTPSGEVKLCDFGLSALAALAARGELGGNVIAGTPQYISPEAIARGSVDHRSDLYSLAATLYDLIVGVPPFGQDSITAYRGHLHEAPPNSPLLPPKVASALFKSMAKRPEDRFDSAEKMRREFIEILSASRKAQLAAAARSTPIDENIQTTPGAPLTSAPPPVNDPSDDDLSSEWITLDEDVVESSDKPPPLPPRSVEAVPPVNERNTKNMKTLEQVIKQEAWLASAVRADASGSVLEITGRVDGETTSAAAAMCLGSLERVAGLTGMGEVVGCAVSAKKATVYIHRDSSGFVVGVGAAASNPEVMMKKFNKALGTKG